MAGRAVRATAAATVLGLAGASLALGLAATSAIAAPRQDYHAGRDVATFTVTGVLDRNCLVSTGGNTVWIRPGDAIRFQSSLAGVDTGRAVSGRTVKTKSVLTGLLGPVTKIVTTSLTGRDVAGLDVRAVLDPASGSPRRLHVSGGHPLTVRGLTRGDHTLRWTATGLALAPGLVNTLAAGQSASVPLSSAALKSGAKLSWSGVVHVVASAPTCTISASTPTVHGSLGGHHVALPGTTASVPGVTLPNHVPSLGDVGGGSGAGGGLGGGSGGSGGSGAASSGGGPGRGIDYTPPSPTVPEEVVPQGGGGATAGSSDVGGVGVTTGRSDGVPAGSTVRTTPGGRLVRPAVAPGAPAGRVIDAASSGDGVGAQLPIVLAVIAVIALTLVAATYAKMFLLDRRG